MKALRKSDANTSSTGSANGHALNDTDELAEEQLIREDTELDTIEERVGSLAEEINARDGQHAANDEDDSEDADIAAPVTLKEIETKDRPARKNAKPKSAKPTPAAKKRATSTRKKATTAKKPSKPAPKSTKSAPKGEDARSVFGMKSEAPCESETPSKHVTLKETLDNAAIQGGVALKMTGKESEGKEAISRAIRDAARGTEKKNANETRYRPSYREVIRQSRSIGSHHRPGWVTHRGAKATDVSSTDEKTLLEKARMKARGSFWQQAQDKWIYPVIVISILALHGTFMYLIDDKGFEPKPVQVTETMEITDKAKTGDISALPPTLDAADADTTSTMAASDTPPSEVTVIKKVTPPTLPPVQSPEKQATQTPEVAPVPPLPAPAKTAQTPETVAPRTESVKVPAQISAHPATVPNASPPLPAREPGVDDDVLKQIISQY